MTTYLKKIRKVAADIKSIKIQGATNVAKAGIAILGEEVQKNKFGSLIELKTFLIKSMLLLRGARETEPMLFNGLKAVLKTYKEESEKNKDPKDVSKIQTAIARVCQKYLKMIEKEERVRPLIGNRLIKKNYNILTHCHSGSVMKLLTTAHKKGKKIKVYNTETRPLYQGRTTSKDLIKAGIPDTMVVDDIAPFFVDNIYESDIDIDMVVIGCDAIKTDGSVYNKTGSFAIALSAWNSKIPLYVVGSLTKVDRENKIHIEERPGKEIRKKAPSKLKIVNYAFDLVPAKFITGIITEHGVIKPKDIKKSVKKHYPRMVQ